MLTPPLHIWHLTWKVSMLHAIHREWTKARVTRALEQMLIRPQLFTMIFDKTRSTERHSTGDVNLHHA